MEVEWDPRKGKANVAKHGVDFADAATALYDEMAVTVLDESSREERYVTLGVDALGRVLVVVYTWRDGRIRIISARKATTRERTTYQG